MLIKQPNGKFCYLVGYYTDKKINLTEQDVIDIYIGMAKKEINNAQHYGYLIERGIVTDEELKEMGSEQTYAELIKLIPREPVLQYYVGCEFATFGDCPNCGNSVRDGIGHTDKNCNKCGQLLKWR